MHLIKSRGSAFGFVVEVVNNDLVVRNVVATWFGGVNDQRDSGQTASGISTRQDPNLLGCALPMDGFHFHKTDGSPIPRLPWGTQVRVTNTKLGRSISLPLIDLGPSKYAASHAAIDLTETAFKLIGGNLSVGLLQVNFTILGAARYLRKSTVVEMDSPTTSTKSKKRPVSVRPVRLRALSAGRVIGSKARPIIRSFIQSPNYSSRNDTPIDMIVLHCTAAEAAGSTINWFLNPKSRVSAHYLIDTNGDIYQMVRDEHSAWHAKTANSRSIGIEHVGVGMSSLPTAQAAASATLIRWLVARYGIPTANIAGHRFAPGNEGTTECPGLLFGDGPDALKKWVTEFVMRGSNRRPGSIWTRSSAWASKMQCDLSRIQQCIEQHPDKGPATLTPLEMMTIVLEDRRYFSHRGVDLPSVVREIINLVTFRKHGGASTIDMQFVRTVTGYRAPTLRRKLYEALLAVAIQPRYSKHEILRAYLACAFFGSGMIGADTTARRFFSKDSNELELEEAAMISAMLAYPRPSTAPATWKFRVERRKRYAISVHSRNKKRFSNLYQFGLRAKQETREEKT